MAVKTVKLTSKCCAPYLKIQFGVDCSENGAKIRGVRSKKNNMDDIPALDNL